jgi:non-heme chloroperoxidase
MRPFTVVSPDGLVVAAQEWGNPDAAEIVFIHGFCQSHLSWLRQVTDPALAARFRMVTYDLRGHGDTGKPTEKSSYDGDPLWADELAAVMAAAEMKRPILVAWSYAGRVVADYLRVHGEAGIAGINYVNARCSTVSAHFGPEQKHLRGMQSDEIAINIAATRAFLRACFELQPTPEDFETMLAFNMVVPAVVRRYVLGRPDDTPDAMARLRLPVLVTHGRRDTIINEAMADFIATSVKGSQLSFYEGIGHAPFWEDAPRFNTELAAFAEGI